MIGAVRRTNIDNISEYGIYWPSEDSTFPDGIDSSDCYVLHYADNGMNSRHFQFFMCPETSTPGSISDYHVLVYTRFSNISYPLGPKDWSPWQPLGGGSSLTAGDGISITDDAVAVDDTVVRTEGEQAINGSLRVWHYASAAVTVSKKDTDDNVYAKLSPNNLYFRFGNNARDFVSITSGGTASSMGNSTYARLTAHNDATMSSAILSVHATDEGMYATAPSTRSTPVDNEIITYDYFRDHAVTLRTGNIYVDNVNGSDSNDGLTADTALATFDAAIALRQKVKFYDPSTNDELVTINLAASTTPYTYSKNTIPTNTAIVGAASDSTTIQLYSELRGVNTRLQFANITLDFVQISNLIVALLYFLTSTVSFIYCTIRKSTNSNIENLLYTGDSGYTYMENTVIDIGDNDNNFEQLIYTNNTSSIIMLSTIITGSGLISYSTVRCNSTSNIFINGLNSTSASLNAKRYDVTLGSGIFVNNAGENAIPGTLPGSVDDTSWYK